MNNINYDEIFNFLNQTNMALLLVIILIMLVVLFLVARVLIRFGLFLLLITFLIDSVIRIIPIDIYAYYPIVQTIVRILYIISFIIFLVKTIRRLRRHSYKKAYFREKTSKKEKEKIPSQNPIKRFFKFTGALPFLLMLILNFFASFENTTYQGVLNSLTALSFLFMVFTTLFNSYKKIDKMKVNDGRMRFDDLKEAFKKDRKKSKNSDRTVLKKENKNKESSSKETVRLNLDDIKKASRKTSKNTLDDIDLKKDLVDTDLVYNLNKSNKPGSVSVLISLTDLKTGERKFYESKKPGLFIKEDREYKVDLEFEDYNDYDYGRFIDILIQYSKNKDKYKLELDLSPKNLPNSKLVFYDPSNLYDLDKDFSGKFQGKTISMNFPKYKINFITEN